MKERKVQYTAGDHTWIVCAFRESPYLEECIRSLENQTVKSTVQIATSTPCDYITDIAQRHGCEVFVNRGETGIGGDWNFALSTGKTELLTIAHQDDVYEPAYTEEMLRRVSRASDPILYFTNYAELRNGQKVEKNRLLTIKRLLLLPLRLFPRRKWARRLSLAFGNPICCPSVTYRASIMEHEHFGKTFKSNLDWEMSEKLSRRKGTFVYGPKVGMCHRIHEASTTSSLIGDHLRGAEDYEMMRKFWPDAIAKKLSRYYGRSEESNRVEEKGPRGKA